MPKAKSPTLFAAAPLPVAKLSKSEVLACLRLIRTDNVGPVAFRDLINTYGGAAHALDALPDIARRAGSRRRVRVFTIDAAEAELDAAERAGAEPVFTIEPGYPAALAAIDAPPPMIYIKGQANALLKPAVAIVGSRQCSAAGAKVAAILAHGLGAAGFAVASGLARGIDGAAHQAALATGTIAVLAGGIDVLYPPEHDALYQSIAERGCLVSERPPGFRPRGQDFPRRNRIISGVSLGVVIVEAAARSGTLVTARYAGEQGRDVFAVPGHPLDPRAEGTNKLIKSGATLVTSADDVIEALEPLSDLKEGALPLRWQPVAGTVAGLANADDADGRPTTPASSISSGEADLVAVLQSLGPAPIDADAIQSATGLSARAVQIALMELDIAGHIARPGPGLVARKDPGADDA
ncbi:MAG: DNA-processing protein DprA [Hyphomicrobium sp.]|nr:DNA-processing protein DprA [Hyphomicrobium sp.]